MSGIVSRDDMLGLRERKLVGVEGMDDAAMDEFESPGKDSLNRVDNVNEDGWEWFEFGLPTGWLSPCWELPWGNGRESCCLRVGRGKVWCREEGKEGVGEGRLEYIKLEFKDDVSSSSCSEIVSEILRDARLKLRRSSPDRNGLCFLPFGNSIGLVGLPE
jgi:hypothetical protein